MSYLVHGILLCLAIGIFASDIPSVSNAHLTAGSLQSSDPLPDYLKPVFCEGMPGVKDARDEEIEWIDDQPFSKLTGKRAQGKPVPPYPPEAKEARIQGTIVVRIVINNAGHVITAQAEGGPAPLVEYAVAAACRARFKPNSEPEGSEKLKGKVTYNFTLQ